MTSEIERVRQWFASGRLLAPVGDVPSTVHLSRALAQLCETPKIPEDEQAAALAAAIGPARQLLFVLVDGLGCNLLETLPADAFLRRHEQIELRAVFPSTTATSLTTLATAAWPGQHAIPGWFTHLPERGITATILPFVERFSTRPLETLGVSVGDAFPHPSAMARYDRAVRMYHPAAIVESVYTRYQRGESTDGRERIGVGYTTLSEAVEAVVQGVREARAPTFHYFYLPIVDGAAHRAGLADESVRTALRATDAALAQITAAVGADVRMVVSADHGMLDTPDERKHLLLEDDPLVEALQAPPSGEPRVPMFHVRTGARAAFLEEFRERFRENFALLTPDEVDELALFGPEPLSRVTRSRIGDFIGIAPGPDVLVYRAKRAESATTMRGFHAGLTPEEMRIPLILVGGG